MFSRELAAVKQQGAIAFWMIRAATGGDSQMAEGMVSSIPPNSLRTEPELFSSNGHANYFLVEGAVG